MADHAELNLPLPDFLEAVDGEVRLTGHRILISHVVRKYRDGWSPEMLWEEFATLKLSHIHKVIAFYLDHHEAVDRYMAERDAEIDRQVAAHPQTFSLAALRERLAAKRRAEAAQRTA